MSSNTFGIIESNEVYHSNDAVGSTTCKGYMGNPVKAYKSWTGEIEMKKTEALVMGSLIHCLALEPHTFKDEFWIGYEGYKAPKEDRMKDIESHTIIHGSIQYPESVLTPSGTLSTSKKAREEIEAFRAESGDKICITPNENKLFAIYLKTKGKTVITQERYEDAQKIANKARAYEFQMTTDEGVFTFTLEDAIKHDSAIMERAFYAWYNPSTKTVTRTKIDEDAIELKTKPDILLDVGRGAYVVIDLKSSIDASPTSFRKGGGFFYHLQEAHYTKVLEANGLKIYKFKFLFIGKEEWSIGQDYEYDIASKELGVDQFHKALLIHQLALKGELRETVFDGGKYDREPVLGLPNYMFYLD